MPCYEFACDTCASEWDEVRPMAESDAPATCPRCAASGSRRWRTVPQGRVPDYSGYHPGMARFPGDPDAHADSKRDLDRKVDQKRREGRTVFDNT